MCTRELFKIVDNEVVENDRKKSWICNTIKSDDIRKFATHLIPGTKFPKYTVTKLPCGKCAECLFNRAKEDAFRAAKEIKYHEHNVMLTLTYDDEHIPTNKVIHEETGEVEEVYTLNRDDLDKFLKRLRKKFGSFRYLLCGEYGTTNEYIDYKGNKRKGTERPHYHIMAFGLNVDDLKFFKFSKCEWSREKNKLLTSKKVSKVWGLGHVELNEANYETAKYIAGYIQKKWKNHKSDEEWLACGKTPPFTSKSNRPGLAHQWFLDNKEKFINQEPLWVTTKKGLKQQPNIRYFDKLLEKECPEEFEKLKTERRKKSARILEEMLGRTDLSEHEYIENSDRKVEKRLRFQTRSGIK